MRDAVETQVKVTVLLTKEEFDRLDAYCRKRGYKKSPLLARLARELLDEEHFGIQSELFAP
jgi:hypothetical protein